MTDRTISPLRRRMTEDMTVRGFTAGTQARIPRGGREFHGLSWPLSGPGERGGCGAATFDPELGEITQHEYQSNLLLAEAPAVNVWNPGQSGRVGGARDRSGCDP